jgi:hypothetical protein
MAKFWTKGCYESNEYRLPMKNGSKRALLPMLEQGPKQEVCHKTLLLSK